MFTPRNDSNDVKIQSQRTKKTKDDAGDTVIVYSVSQKIPPTAFWNFFPKRLGIFKQFLTHLLHDHFYTRLEIFIYISNFDKVMPY